MTINFNRDPAIAIDIAGRDDTKPFVLPAIVENKEYGRKNNFKFLSF